MIHDTLILEILLLGLMCMFLYNSLNNMKINISWAIFLSGTMYVLPLDSAQLPGNSHMQTPEASISSQAHGAPRWGGYSDGHVCQETVIRHHTETVFRTHEYPPWRGAQHPTFSLLSHLTLTALHTILFPWGAVPPDKSMEQEEEAKKTDPRTGRTLTPSDPPVPQCNFPVLTSHRAQLNHLWP